jgi:hypothetical protein
LFSEKEIVIPLFREIIFFNAELKSTVSEIGTLASIGVYLMIEAEQISETLVFSSTLMRLLVQEDFSAFIRSESFKSYRK